VELKEFIKETVKSISDAIEEINSDENMTGKVIANPNDVVFYGDTKSLNRLVYPIEKGIQTFSNARLIQELEFDLMISESKETSSGGGVKLNVVSGGINKSSTTDNMNRVKFSIPFVFLK
jgi:hypothetical protein